MIVLYLLGLNLWAFVAFGADKRRAERGERRLPERMLLTLAALGGSAGAIAGQQVFRHKTRKEPFRTILWLTPVAQAVVVAVWLWGVD